MKSMTGYGKGMVAGDDFSVSVDLKTVNNRFLDIHLRVGSELASLEPSIKKRITSQTVARPRRRHRQHGTSRTNRLRTQPPADRRLRQRAQTATTGLRHRR